MVNANYESMDLFADILEPAAMILADKNVLGVFNRKEPIIRVVKYAIRNHKDEVIEILARIDSVPVEDYRFDGLKVTMKLLTFLNRPDVLQMIREVFSSPQSDAAASSGAAMENTEAAEN